MLQVFIISAALLTWYLALHWLHPRLVDRRQTRGNRSRVSRWLVPHRHDAREAGAPKATDPRAIREQAQPAELLPLPGAQNQAPTGAGLNGHQRAAPLPAHLSIRDLDQGRKVEVGPKLQRSAASRD